MRKYTVLAVLTLQAGTVVGLSADQAERRRHLLKAIDLDKKNGGGTYEVLQPVQFKVGEVIATNADLNKQLAEALEPVEATAAKEKAKAAEKGDSKAQAELKAKAKAWDDLQPELEQLRTKAAAFDLLDDDDRKVLLDQLAAAKKGAQ